jgi:hypothetical protein
VVVVVVVVTVSGLKNVVSPIDLSSTGADGTARLLSSVSRKARIDVLAGLRAG